MPIRYDDDRVRITVSVDPEVLHAYQEAASGLGISVSRFVGDWLADTKDSMQLVTGKMMQARGIPSELTYEMERIAGQEMAEAGNMASGRRRKGG